MCPSLSYRLLAEYMWAYAGSFIPSRGYGLLRMIHRLTALFSVSHFGSLLAILFAYAIAYTVLGEIKLTQ